MLDPILSLAFTLHSNKGTYALLLGSGVSRSAGIPTGWNVVLDLVRKVAVAAGAAAAAEPDPLAWYRRQYGQEPDYGRLLDDLTKTPAEKGRAPTRLFRTDRGGTRGKAKAPDGGPSRDRDLRGFLRRAESQVVEDLLREPMEAELRASAAVLDFEPAWPGGAVKTRRKGSGSFVLRAHGRAAHAGADFTRGANAILELARQVVAVSQLTDLARA